jgi:hypothetical protein
METVQIVLDKKLLQATDRAACRTKLNRSALREKLYGSTSEDWKYALRKGVTVKGNARQPQSLDEVRLWEAEAVWPAE